MNSKRFVLVSSAVLAITLLTPLSLGFDKTYPMINSWESTRGQAPSSLSGTTYFPWPMHLYNATHSAFSQAPATETDDVLWWNYTGYRTFSSPAVANGMVFIGAQNVSGGYMYAFYQNNGTLAWKMKTIAEANGADGGGFSSSPAYSNGLIFFGGDRIYAVYANNGTIKWTVETGNRNYGDGSPTVADGKVFIGAGNRKLYAIDQLTGTVLWTFQTDSGGPNNYGVFAAPAVWNGSVYVAACDGYVYQLNISQPGPVATANHKFNAGSAIYGSPVIFDNKVYVGTGYWIIMGGNRFFALEASNLSLIWQFYPGSPTNFFSSAGIAYNKVFIGSYDGNLYALDPWSGNEIWRYPIGPTWSSPAISSGKLFIGSKSGYLYSFNISQSGSPTLNWKYQTGGGVDSSPAISDGKVCVGTHGGNGRVYCLGKAWTPNRPPKADAGGPYQGYEASSIVLDGSGSNDPDNDILQYRWDFENDGAWDTQWSPSPRATHTWGDDYVGVVALQVSDGNLTDTDTANVTIMNILPSGTLSMTTPQHEGSPITFSAHVTDSGSDDLFLMWKWGFGAADEYSTYYNNGASPDPYPSPDMHPRDITDVKTHTYGDNGAFTITVFVRDDDSGNQGTTLTITATPGNLPPSVSVSGGMSINEGQSVTLTATAKDPGSDDLTFAWSWGEGSSESRIYYDNGVSPDPSNSPGGTYPFTATDTATHPYGDNGLYTVTLTVTDDDGGSTSWAGQVTVINLPPSIQPFGPFNVTEGSPLSVSATATDPGSDDLIFTWTFELGPTVLSIHYNNGVSPDPPQSPGGTYPFTVTDGVNQTYGDNGVYILTLTVTDDDGGLTTSTTEINVVNLPPVIKPFGPFEVNEGDPLSVLANATDPGSDDLTFTWTFEYGPTVQDVYCNNGIGPDPPKSPWGTFPFSVEDLAAHTYGDNGVFKISLRVEDDDGGIATHETSVTVLNIPPTILDVKAYALADITLRVTGEKWHDVVLRLYVEGNETGYARIIRYPGSPDDQSVTLNDVEVRLDRRFSAVAYYTPADDMINGQPNGADPAWLIIHWENGDETRLQHTFNVMHNETWVWTVANFNMYAVNQIVHLRGTAHDVGSDDLTFTWDSGDGRAFSATVYNNGASPDPYPSPDMNPITATSEVRLVYSLVGTYTITLTVTDDDGSATRASFDVAIG